MSLLSITIEDLLCILQYDIDLYENQKRDCRDVRGCNTLPLLTMTSKNFMEKKENLDDSQQK